MTFQDIQTKIDNAQNLDFGKILDQSIKLFKEVWLKGFLMILIIMIFGGVLAFLFVSIGLIPNPYDAVGLQEINFLSYYAMSALNNLPQNGVINSSCYWYDGWVL